MVCQKQAAVNKTSRTTEGILGVAARKAGLFICNQPEMNLTNYKKK